MIYHTLYLLKVNYDVCDDDYVTVPFIFSSQAKAKEMYNRLLGLRFKEVTHYPLNAEKYVEKSVPVFSEKNLVVDTIKLDNTSLWDLLHFCQIEPSEIEGLIPEI